MQQYLEIRTPSAHSPAATADLTRHLLKRQHLGKTVVVCDRPAICMSVARKYWLKLSRSLQKERASTLNAEKILQLTYDITHMQHMEFTTRSYQDASHADVYFMTPDQLMQLPTNCLSVYVLRAPSQHELQSMLGQLPDLALVIDYTHSKVLASAALMPKLNLEQLLPQRWQCVDDFLRQHGVDIRQLSQASGSEQLDKVIDVILNTGTQFLRVSDDFLQLLRLAQPLAIPGTEQQMYDTLSTLNRRIYTLTPGILSQQFMQTFSDDDISFHDTATEDMALALAV